MAASENETGSKAFDEEAGNSEIIKVNSIDELKLSTGYGFPKVKLSTWDPENKEQWEAVGKSIAIRNLWASIPNLTCGFGVWLVWSVIVSKIQTIHDKDESVYPFQDISPDGFSKKEYKVVLYLLPAIAGLSGGTLRIPNSFLTQVSGGRNVVYNTSFLLCIPMLLAGIALSDPNCPFVVLMIAAMLSGVGGGAFASSMSNISFFYPKRQQGYALGMNGGLGNLGVSISQYLALIVMDTSYGRSQLTDKVSGWPNHAGWLWFPLCAASAITAFFWMSNQPHHGNKSTVISIFHYYWMEMVGILCSTVGMVVLYVTRDSSLTSTAGGKIGQKFLLVFIVAFLEHFFLWFVTPAAAKTKVRAQAVIFKDKHTYIMTWLYIMCFGSFIGFSGSFPKLITDIFGYVKGCKHTDETFTIGMSESACLAEGSSYFTDYTNPNAPDLRKWAGLGALVGSLIRPVGGILSDKFGGSKVTMVAIVWCTIAAFAQGVLVKNARQMDRPDKVFGWFVFLLLNLFFTTGAMNGSTFRTIGVLFKPEESGPVLGWSSAIASYGAFVIPSMFGVTMSMDVPEYTFFGLGAYYVTCGLLCFWYYIRPGCEKPGV